MQFFKRKELSDAEHREKSTEEGANPSTADNRFANMPQNDRNITKTSSGGDRRRTQVVTTISEREIVKKWMSKEVAAEAERIPSRALDNFPEIFKAKDSTSNQAALKKARRWLALVRSSIDDYKFDSDSDDAEMQNDNTEMGDDDVTETSPQPEVPETRADHVDRGGTKKKQKSITRCIDGVRSRIFRKAGPGRGRKRAEWVKALYSELSLSFRCVRRAGVKVNGTVLRAIASNIIQEAEEGSPLHRSTVDPSSGRAIGSCIDAAWIRRFCLTCGIVNRTQTGKLMVSDSKRIEIDESIVRHLARLKHDFISGFLDEDLCFNMDETAFHVNMDDSKTLDWRGVLACKYHDVTSGGQNFTMMVNVSGGRRGTIEPCFLVFQNASCNYPTRKCPDDIPGVSYRTGPKGWMDRRVFNEMLQEPRFIRKDPHGRKKIVFIDNVGSHSLTPEVENSLRLLNIEIRFLPPNSTDLTQPADSFVIQAIKSAWMAKWDAYKYSQIKAGAFRDKPGQAGHIPNPQKHYFLQLAADSVAEARKKVDSNGLNFARKAMIRCGLSLDVDGIWREKQLKPELQTLISKYKSLYDAAYKEQELLFAQRSAESSAAPVDVACSAAGTNGAIDSRPTL